jgi:hypothetical protein
MPHAFTDNTCFPSVQLSQIVHQAVIKCVTPDEYTGHVTLHKENTMNSALSNNALSFLAALALAAYQVATPGLALAYDSYDVNAAGEIIGLCYESYPDGSGGLWSETTLDECNKRRRGTFYTKSYWASQIAYDPLH